MFYFGDISAKGVQQWMDIRTEFHRVIDPLRALVYGADDFLETRILYTGVAIEALGYQLSGKTATFPKALELIERDLPFVPVKDAAAWKERSRQCYKGVKHADNLKPNIAEMVTVYRENVLVLRVWLAARLGCSPDTIKNHLRTDPLNDVARTDWT